MITFVIDDPIYTASFMVQIGGQINDIVKRYAKALKVDAWDIPNNRRLGHFACKEWHKGGCVWFKNLKNIGIIAHETLHATCQVMYILQINLNDNSEEIFTYYQQWLINEIMKKGKK